MNNINWYVEITEGAVDGYRSDTYLKTVIDTVTPFMNYFYNRLLEVEDWVFVDLKETFQSIIDEMPIFQCYLEKGEIVFRYNKWVVIKLTDSVKQIYRDIKLEKILNTL